MILRLTLLTLCTLFLGLSSTAQSITWRLDGVTGERPGPAIGLSDGNILHHVRAPQGGSTFYVVSPAGERLEGIGFSDCCDYVHLREVGVDSVLALAGDGQLFLLTERFTMRAYLGNAFPALNANGPLHGMRIMTTDDEEVVARAWGNYDGQYESRIRYNDSLEIRERTREWEDIRIAYAADGTEALLVTDFPLWHVIITTNNGRDTTLTFMYDDESTDMFFTPDGDLRLLGFTGTSAGPTGFIYKYDQETLSLDTTYLDADLSLPQTIFYGHKIVGDQLVLHGQRGDFGGWMTVAGLTMRDDLVWSYTDDTQGSGQRLNRASSVIIPDNDPDVIFLAGTYGQTDVPPFENAFLLRLGEAPLATSGARPEPLSIYPNPAENLVTLTGLPAGSYSAEVYDAAGRRTVLAARDGAVDIVELPAGRYVLRITVKQKVYVGKFIKR